ncbi:MAG: penicillin-binding protein 1C [Bacteroidetes bacterium]|nr:penicillin-binding protein 1C [Bacteroidota bacterium]
MAFLPDLRVPAISGPLKSLSTRFPLLSRFFLTGVGFFCLFILADFSFPLPSEPDYSVLVTDSTGLPLYSFLSRDEKWRVKTELSEISDQLKKSLIFKEDKFFYWHPGINPVSIVKAAWQNVTQDRIVAGASTITLQTVRLLEPRRRTYSAKLIEFFRALQLELHYSKDEILQLYLNLVPYGGNIEGVKSASLLCFGRSPEKLSLSQVVSLTVIPNRPGELNPVKYPERVRAERDLWLNRMKQESVFQSEEIESALREPLDIKRQPLPSVAPHLSARLKAQFPDSAVIRSTIHRESQLITESLVKNHVRRMSSFGISQAAVLVMDNRTARVIAYAGSADFQDIGSMGQVDGVKAVRSPGSTLKPFAYGLAMDKGIVTPKTVLLDVPLSFSGYMPENFNEEFTGQVTVEEALARSLNLPVVSVTALITPGIFTSFLADAGFRQIGIDRPKLGLSVVLGGCGVRLEELVPAYSAFSRGGRFRPLKFHSGDTSGFTVPLLTEGTAWTIGKILTSLTRPDFPDFFQSGIHVPKIAWKTGTSYGRRDGWSIGFNSRLTIGVWTGNFSGEGVPELTGAEIATPLLFDLFNALDYSSTEVWFPRPVSLDFRLVCPQSGLPPGENCENPVMDDFLPAVSSNRKCTHLKKVKTDLRETKSYCTRCDPGLGTVSHLYPNLPPELIAFYEEQGLSYQKIPPHNPACTRIFTETGPGISSPVDHAAYFLDKKEKSRIQLLAYAESDVSTLYWYINNRLLTESAPGKPVWFSPDPGGYRILVTDDKGRSSSCFITVTSY